MRRWGHPVDLCPLCARSELRRTLARAGGPTPASLAGTAQLDDGHQADRALRTLTRIGNPEIGR
jgi:hypothetical protein